jgi:hypothetical protein
MKSSGAGARRKRPKPPPDISLNKNKQHSLDGIPRCFLPALPGKFIASFGNAGFFYPYAASPITGGVSMKRTPQSIVTSFLKNAQRQGEAFMSGLQSVAGNRAPVKAPRIAKPRTAKTMKESPDAQKARTVTAQPEEPKPAPRKSRERLITAPPVRRRQTAAVTAVPARTSSGVFTLIQNKDEFERILFVLKACNKQSERAFTTVLHVEQTRTGSRLVATDGIRLHVAEIGTKIRSGNYKPVVSKDTIRLGAPVRDVEFPAWTKVVPVRAARRGVINLEAAGVGKARSASMAMTRAYNAFVRQSGEKVNPHFLEDLPKRQWVIYCQNEKRKPLVLKEDGAAMETYAVIMPLAA